MTTRKDREVAVDLLVVTSMAGIATMPVEAREVASVRMVESLAVLGVTTDELAEAKGRYELRANTEKARQSMVPPGLIRPS